MSQSSIKALRKLFISPFPPDDPRTKRAWKALKRTYQSIPANDRDRQLNELAAAHAKLAQEMDNLPVT